ncbi:MAG: hypothetical protein KKA60_11690, partial [Proteobacteria bacterium]|nr:hypothetical protein [Pseudomonadota bacterium]
MSVSQRLQRLEEISSRLAQEISALKREAAEADPTPGREPEGSAGPASALALYLSLGQGYEKDALLRMILECAMHTVHAGGAGLTLLDPKKDRLVFQAAVGDGAEGIIGYEVPLEGSRHGLAFATGEIQSSTPIHKEI